MKKIQIHRHSYILYAMTSFPFPVSPSTATTLSNSPGPSSPLMSPFLDDYIHDNKLGFCILVHIKTHDPSAIFLLLQLPTPSIKCSILFSQAIHGRCILQPPQWLSIFTLLLPPRVILSHSYMPDIPGPSTHPIQNQLYPFPPLNHHLPSWSPDFETYPQKNHQILLSNPSTCNHSSIRDHSLIT